MQVSATSSAPARLNYNWRAHRAGYATGLAPLPNSSQESTSPEMASPAASTRELTEIQGLLHHLSKQRRWVYYFAESTRIRSTHTNILQIPLKSRSCLLKWVHKVVHSKQCCAVVIEKDSLADCPAAIVQQYCQFAGVALIVLDTTVNRATIC